MLMFCLRRNVVFLIININRYILCQILIIKYIIFLPTSLWYITSIFLDSLATSGVSGHETCLSNSEVYTNHTTDADDLSYSKKRKRYSRLGLVRVFSRGKKKSEDSRGRQKHIFCFCHCSACRQRRSERQSCYHGSALLSFPQIWKSHPKFRELEYHI